MYKRQSQHWSIAEHDRRSRGLGCHKAWSGPQVTPGVCRRGAGPCLHLRRINSVCGARLLGRLVPIFGHPAKNVFVFRFVKIDPERATSRTTKEDFFFAPVAVVDQWLLSCSIRMSWPDIS